MKKRITIATRVSKLALWQTNWVRETLMAQFPELAIGLLELKTRGDKILDTPLTKIGGKGLFVKELEVAILEGRADMAVHSLKDVPIDQPPGLTITPVAPRGNPGDAFVSARYAALDDLPAGAVVGTSSLRRSAQLRHHYPALVFESLRGNVDTRLRKLDEGRFDAIILAAAGLERLDYRHRIAETLSYEISLPAIGQGAICIELRSDDAELKAVIQSMVDETSNRVLSAERALLRRLNGGCQVPLAGHGSLENGGIRLDGLIASPDGSQFLKMSEFGEFEEAEAVGERLGKRLIEAGGREILAAVGISVDIGENPISAIENN